MQPYRLANIEIQRYYQNEPKLNGFYWRKNLPKAKEWVCIIYYDKYKLIAAHWIKLYVNGENVTRFDSFWAEFTAKETKMSIGNKNIIRKWFNNLWQRLYWFFWFYAER